MQRFFRGDGLPFFGSTHTHTHTPTTVHCFCVNQHWRPFLRLWRCDWLPPEFGHVVERRGRGGVVWFAERAFLRDEGFTHLPYRHAHRSLVGTWPGLGRLGDATSSAVIFPWFFFLSFYFSLLPLHPFSFLRRGGSHRIVLPISE